MRIKRIYEQVKHSSPEHQEMMWDLLDEVLEDVKKYHPDYYKKYEKKVERILDNISSQGRNYMYQDEEEPSRRGAAGYYQSSLRGGTGYNQIGYIRSDEPMNRRRYGNYNTEYTNRSGNDRGDYNNRGSYNARTYSMGMMHHQGGGGSQMGEYLDREQAQMYVGRLQNEDGSRGPHWDEQTVREVYKNHEELQDFGFWDVYYVLNMMYSDYYDPQFTTKTYVKLTCKFLNDKDAPKDKVLRYAEAMER